MFSFVVRLISATLGITTRDLPEEPSSPRDVTTGQQLDSSSPPELTEIREGTDPCSAPHHPPGNSPLSSANRMRRHVSMGRRRRSRQDRNVATDDSFLLYPLLHVIDSSTSGPVSPSATDANTLNLALLDPGPQFAVSELIATSFVVTPRLVGRNGYMMEARDLGPNFDRSVVEDIAHRLRVIGQEFDDYMDSALLEEQERINNSLWGFIMRLFY
ncbi:hypothetical protein QR680_006427 [Steinernema hermaphroditum]|uniref:Uncharacterized protein n=1 Tax=Steinernema hermaphroditum TaxID=289476 RepID=A0AA39LX44_9BILA|nr:hypothetical protein QR680_006427 [Steinernema hermaphroditum]